MEGKNCINRTKLMSNLSTNYVVLTTRDAEQPKGDTGRGQIATALSRQIAYERTPELFDTKELQDRDTEIQKLVQLRESDSMLCIDRKNKPVYLTNSQQRLIYALSYGISQEIDSEDVKRKIANPIKTGNMIVRVANIKSLSLLLYDSARKRERQKVLQDLYDISHIRQVQILEIGGKKVRITAPLISLGTTIEDLTPEEFISEGSPCFDSAEIILGAAFFVELDKRFAIVTPKLFEVWRKKGRGTELYGVLLSNLLSVYWQFRKAADKAEERVKKESKSLPEEEKAQQIAEAKRKALLFDINVTRIKEKVTRDYESKRSYKAAFWVDLENAIQGLKELGLIENAYISKGAKGQEKVTFLFSESYNFADKSEETPLLLDEKNSDGEDYPSAF